MTDMIKSPAHYTGHKSGVECMDLARWLTFETGNAWKYLWRYGLKGDRWEQLGKARRNIESALDGPTRPVRDHDDIPHDVWVKFYEWDDVSDGNVADAMRCIWHSQFAVAPVGELQAALDHVDIVFASLRLPTVAELRSKYVMLHGENVQLKGENGLLERERDQLLYERESA